MPVGFADMDAIREWYRRAGPGARPTDAEVERLLRALLDRMRRDPLVEAYVRRNGARNTEGWHAIGEQRTAVLTLAYGGLDPDAPVEVPLVNDIHGGLLGRAAGASAIAGRLLLAQPYLWMDAIEQHVEASPPLPRHTVARDPLPYPIMFWSLQGAKVAPTGEECNWLLLTDEGDHLTVQADITTPPAVRHAGQGATRTRLAHIDIPYGRVWPDDFSATDGAVAGGIEYILKSLAFLASPYVVAQPARVPRAFRRAAARAAGVKHAAPAVDPVCHVVVLREPQQARALDPEPWDGTRQHHWWVAGHYRAQWYPSLKGHKVIWIAPHLQGDLSKPLLQKVYKVAR